MAIDPTTPPLAYEELYPDGDLAPASEYGDLYEDGDPGPPPPDEVQEAGDNRSHPIELPNGWPKPDERIFHGPLGSFVRDAEPHTEADPVAVLATTLAGFGAACHRGPHILVGNERHPAGLNVVIVGPTSAGAKGTSKAVAKALIAEADPELIAHRTLSGFGSGESLVDAIRDATDDDDDAPRDTRLWVVESEYARLLKVAGRDGSTLSMVLRDGFDGIPLQARSRSRTSVASNYHLAMTGHVTFEELRARLTDVETYGGWTNRFAFFASHRTQLLPDGGNIPDGLISRHADGVRQSIIKARARGRLRLTPAASKRWTKVYLQIAEDEPGGLLGAVVGRAAPYVLRFSLVYALADRAETIDVDHIEAGWHLWQFARTTAEMIFGDAVGEEVADKLLAAIRRSGPAGLDLTEQSAALGRNVQASQLRAARRRLEDLGHIATAPDPNPTGGRNRTVSFASTKKHESTNQRDRSFVSSSTFVEGGAP